MVLNNPPSLPGLRDGGPCYRCVFPKPPPAASVLSCGEGGILGPVVGVMGVLMAMEAIKIILAGLDIPEEVESNGNEQTSTKDPHSLLLYSAYGYPPFRSVRLRGKRARCDACSADQAITKDSLKSGSLDYAVFCGTTSPVNILNKEERIDANDYAQRLASAVEEHVLVDVRDKVQFDMCSVDGSLNIPFAELDSCTAENVTGSDHPELQALHASDAPIYTVCRFGNDSQLAVQKLKALGYDNNGKRYIGDIKGGFRVWKEDVDPTWPEY